MEKRKALIAMSGGVDSSVAALLMRDSGYDCIGCTMRLFDREDVGETQEEPDGGAPCCSLDSVEDARSVCSALGIPYYVFNFREDFTRQVIDRFVCAYLAGMTPNPCVDCNRYLKFDRLYRRAAELGCDMVVTGHYARIAERDGRYVLLRSLDPAKDQSYVLYDLTQERLAHTAFPLGGLTKDAVRRIAGQHGFVNAGRRDSQDICFAPDGDYARVIEERTGRACPPGDFIDTEGNVLGRHRGIIRYTRGQRRGLGLSLKESLYVLRVDPENNTVVLGRNEELYSRELTAEDFNWISGEVPDRPVRCLARVRYRQSAQPAIAEAVGDGSVHIVFDEPQRAITPGQSAVLYGGEDGSEVLGGGIIRA